MAAMERHGRGVRVLIVDDHALFAESLDLALGMEGYDVHRMTPPGRGSSPAGVVAVALRHQPRIALVDLDLGPFGDGLQLVPLFAGAGVHVIVVTASTDRARWGECVRHGARKVVSKSLPLNDILATVRRLNQGLAVMTREERDELLRAWQSQNLENRDLRRRLALLTPREQVVLHHLMEGQVVRDIARVSVVSEATVRTQVKAILAKLEVSSQLAAVGLAHRVGWSPTTPVPQHVELQRRTG